MFAGIGVFNDDPATETTGAIPVNALEFDAIVIAVVGSVMEANKLHPWKALVPIDVTLAGIIILGNDAQPWKAFVWMEVTLEPKITFITFVLFEKFILSDALELVYV